jgi:hypothetical protein
MARDAGLRRLWYLALTVLVVYVLLSGAIAIGTADKCNGLRGDKRWEYIPPRWDCTP